MWDKTKSGGLKELQTKVLNQLHTRQGQLAVLLFSAQGDEPLYICFFTLNLIRESISTFKNIMLGEYEF